MSDFEKKFKAMSTADKMDLARRMEKEAGVLGQTVMNVFNDYLREADSRGEEAVEQAINVANLAAAKVYAVLAVESGLGPDEVHKAIDMYAQHHIMHLAQEEFGKFTKKPTQNGPSTLQ